MTGDDCADVSAVVVAYGAVALLRRTVDSLRASGVGEIIVWDNSPDEIDRQAVAALADDLVQVLSSGENLGFGRANNAAALRATGRFLLLVNPDCEVTAECVGRMRHVAHAPDVGVVAPRMVYPNGVVGFAGGPAPSMTKELLAATRLDDLLPSSARRRLIGLFERLTGRAERGLLVSTAEGGLVDLDWVSGFCMLLRAEVFADVGGFDPDFFMYFEDVDLCDRLRTRGLRVVLARDAQALHHQSATTGGRKSALYWDGLVTYWRARGSSVRYRVALAARWIVRRLGGI